MIYYNIISFMSASNLQKDDNNPLYNYLTYTVKPTLYHEVPTRQV